MYQSFILISNPPPLVYHSIPFALFVWVDIIISSFFWCYVCVFIVVVVVIANQNRTRLVRLIQRLNICRCLSAEAVKGLSLSLEGIDDIHGGDSLSASMLGVGD